MPFSLFGNLQKIRISRSPRFPFESGKELLRSRGSSKQDVEKSHCVLPSFFRRPRGERLVHRFWTPIAIALHTQAVAVIFDLVQVPRTRWNLSSLVRNNRTLRACAWSNGCRAYKGPAAYGWRRYIPRSLWSRRYSRCNRAN